MNDLTIGSFGGAGQPQTMSSREIAELTGKRHDNVRADIEKMGKELSLNFQDKSEPSEGGRPMKVYHLEKRETLILVSGYNMAMRAAIIDRWQILEDRRSPEAMLNDPSSLRSLLLENVEKVIALQTQVAADAPKVAFADQVAAAPDAISLNQAAKTLGTGRTRLAAFLRQKGWLTRTNEPYQDKINSGLLDVKIGCWEHPEKGLQRSVTALVTGKGLAKLHQLFTAH